MGRVAEIVADQEAGAEVLAGLGHNNPPDPTPFDAIKVHIDDLTETARGILDGSGVTTQAECDAVSKLLDEGRKATKAADQARAEEKKPHDDATKAIQAKWKPLIEAGEMIATLCKKAQLPFLEALEAEKLRIAAEARRTAEEATLRAAEAARAANATDLEAQERAATLVKEASMAVTVAKRAEGDKAHGVGGSRATTLRTNYRPVLVDRRAACAHYWTINPAAFDGLLMNLAAADVRASKHQIPGFDVVADRSVV
jgi:hypothetical protein